MIVESSPSFWECPSPMSFTHCKARGRGYYDPKLGIEREGSCTYSRVGGILYLQIGIISVLFFKRDMSNGYTPNGGVLYMEGNA
jgi:hypothetical protein